MSHTFTNIHFRNLADLSVVSKNAEHSPCEAAAFKYRLADNNVLVAIGVTLRSLSDVEVLGQALRSFMTNCTTENLSGLLLPVNQQLHAAYLWMAVHLARLQVVKLNVSITMSRTSLGTALQMKIQFVGGTTPQTPLECDRYVLER